MLETSYSGAFKRLKRTNPDVKIGYVSFIKLKPKNARHLKAMERNVCCENLKLKLSALNKFVKRYDEHHLENADVDDLSDKSM